MVIELLGLDTRWNAFASDESFTVPLKSMTALFEQAAQRWFTTTHRPEFPSLSS